MCRTDSPSSRTLPVLIVAALLAAGGLRPAGAQAQEGEPEFVQQGTASWYGPGFHGRRTANGERFDQNDLTAAHPTLPLDSEATVTNLENGRSVDVEINDRGPYKGGRIIDLSKAAAEKLDMTEDGTAPVRVEVDEVARQEEEQEGGER
jgi:rare lipoprotein A